MTLQVSTKCHTLWNPFQTLQTPLTFPSPHQSAVQILLLRTAMGLLSPPNLFRLLAFRSGIHLDISTTRCRFAKSSSSSSLKFLEWPKQQHHHEDHYSQSKYEQSTFLWKQIYLRWWLICETVCDHMSTHILRGINLLRSFKHSISPSYRLSCRQSLIFTIPAVSLTKETQDKRWLKRKPSQSWHL